MLTKPTQKLHLTSIHEARLMKHSKSNSSMEFKPIQLKSLQEARNAKKSTSNRALSTDLNISIFSNISSTQSTSQNISPVRSNASRILRSTEKTWNVKESIFESVKEAPKRSAIIYKKNPATKRKILNNSLEIQKKNQVKGGLCKSRPTRQNSESQNNSIHNLSISEVLNIMENIKPQKRLTKGQEKGLVSRLHYKSALKTNKSPNK